MSLVAIGLATLIFVLLNALFGYWRWHMGAMGAMDPQARSSTGEATCGAA